MKAVLDTVIFVRGLINPFSQCGRIVFDHADSCEYIVSPQVTAEYLKVLWRPELVRKFRSTGTRDLHAVLGIIARATVVQLTDIPAICRDPADDKFLATAKVGSAQFIVTEDADLLDLGTYGDIQIVTADVFLRVLDQPTA